MIDKMVNGGSRFDGAAAGTVTARGSLLGDGIPPSIVELERSLTAAFHAFDAIDLMTMGHRIRVVDEVTGLVPDAASAAARAGFGPWAETIVRTAAERRPAWSALCTRWDALIEMSLMAISSYTLVWDDDVDDAYQWDVA